MRQSIVWRVWWRVLLAVPLAAAACVWGTGPDWVVVPGFIGVGSLGVPLEVLSAPDTVNAGEPFNIVVTTFGSSSCTRAAGANSSVSGLSASIVPLDSVLRGDVVCTDDLKPFPRDVSLTFGTAGQGLIAVTGRSRVGDTTVTRSIVVR
ncbi:MAG: hypothetical protein KatS3mg081_2434 [Gemmatimonadales bacterium]|nr:MAG: hypothetical protein KatS3mg081_2434 [Gemmatimonadales bacterium]